MRPPLPTFATRGGWQALTLAVVRSVHLHLTTIMLGVGVLLFVGISVWFCVFIYRDAQEQSAPPLPHALSASNTRRGAEPQAGARAPVLPPHTLRR